MYTDRIDKKDTHWWSFLDIHSKNKIFLFDSSGFSRLKEFIIEDDKNKINKIMLDLKKTKK